MWISCHDQSNCFKLMEKVSAYLKGISASKIFGGDHNGNKNCFGSSLGHPCYL